MNKTARQVHGTKKAKDFFIAHLRYLFKISRQARYKREDYQELVRLLREEDHWKARSRGKPTTSHLYGKKKFTSTDDEVIYSGEVSLYD